MLGVNGAAAGGSAGKWAVGGAFSILGATLLPLYKLIVVAVCFVLIDLMIGIWASRVRARKSGTLERWGIESKKMWNTAYKLVLVMGGITLAWMLDTQILDFLNLKLANLFTGFICGVEFWSYLENSAEISNHKIFRKLQKYMKKRVGDGLGTDFKEEEENE